MTTMIAAIGDGRVFGRRAMRDDLLDAQAAVNWAESHFQSLHERLTGWVKSNVKLMVKHLDSNATHDVVIAVEEEILPRAFNVEVGAYINVIRTSLDILATALVNRYSNTGIKDVCFPVAKDAAAFVNGKYTGVKFVKGLPAAERTIIESLKPYRGGNDALWLLHRLDIERKHRRLIEIDLTPA